VALTDVQASNAPPTVVPDAAQAACFTCLQLPCLVHGDPNWLTSNYLTSVFLHPRAGLMFIIWSTYWLYSVIDIHLRTRALGLRAGLPTHTVRTLRGCSICSPSHAQTQQVPRQQHPHNQQPGVLPL
jgi:hypothetical protein